MVTLGIRYDLRNPSFAGTTMQERYDAALEQIAWADRLGFSSVTLSEHHGVDDGYLPSLFPFAAAVAAQTRSIRIRLGALIVPLHDPLRVAEDAAVVDLLSHGRLEIVLANGYVAGEFAMFGRELGDRVRLVTEAFAVLRRAWTGEVFDFRGRSVRITPCPAHPGGPPLLLGGSSAGAARRAARIADGFVPALPGLWDEYRDELRLLGRADPGEVPPGGPMYLHVSHDPDAAWEQIAPHAMYEMNAYGAWAAESGSATGFAPISDPAVLRSMGLYRMLTPAQSIEMINGLGPRGHVTFHPMMGGVAPALAWENLSLFETDVLPHLDRHRDSQGRNPR